MSTMSPSEAKRCVLSAVYRLCQELPAPPTAQQIASELEARLPKTLVCELVHNLIRTNRLVLYEGGLVLTRTGVDHLQRREGLPMAPEPGQGSGDLSLASLEERMRELGDGPLGFDLPIVGEVKAGRVKEFELREDVGEVLFVPKVAPGNDIFGYRVVGQSMEEEHIYEGDYLIVEAFAIGWPKDGEMIVTLYQDEPSELAREQGEIEDAEMRGPVVKVFAEIQDRDGPVYRLSWKKAGGNDLHEIKTHKIAPIGRVIAVYRPIGPDMRERP